MEFNVLSFINYAHATTTEFFHNPVVRNGLADYRRMFRVRKNQVNERGKERGEGAGKCARKTKRPKTH